VENLRIEIHNNMWNFTNLSIKMSMNAWCAVHNNIESVIDSNINLNIHHQKFREDLIDALWKI